MSILIKGIKLPTHPDELRLIIRPNGQVIICRRTEWDETEAIELPPHGRLIDADAFEADRRKNYCEDCERRKGKKNGKWTFVYEIGGVACLPCGIEDVLDDLEDAPTIIEEEEVRDES